MEDFKRCEIINSNPVLLARHFQYRVEVFFKEIVSDGPLGNVKYHDIRVEFQFRGSPYIHSFLRFTDAPGLTKGTKKELQELDITEIDYYNAFSVSTDGDFQVHFRRQPNLCFVNKQTLISSQL